MSFERKSVQHRPPDWVEDGALFFITICAARRHSSDLVAADVPAAIREAAAFYQTQGRWWVELLVLMPDHLHGLISFNQREHSMSATIGAWKSYLNRTAGLLWQRGYFDHRLRSEDAIREKAHYLRLNPVRAGLVAEPSEWPYIWNSESLIG